jgi:hypothetical protein
MASGITKDPSLGIIGLMEVIPAVSLAGGSEKKACQMHFGFFSNLLVYFIDMAAVVQDYFSTDSILYSWFSSGWTNHKKSIS